MISASATNRWRLTGSSACLSRICFSATSRCNSPSSATKTAPRPPRACGRRMRNRWPSEVAEPTAIAGGALGVIVFGLGGQAVLAPGDPCKGGLDVRLAQLRQAGAGGPVGRHGGQALLDVAAVRLEVNRRPAPPAAPAWRRSGRRGLPGGRPDSSTCRASTPGRRPRAGPG